MVKTIRGSCLCRKVRFVIDGMIGPVGQCHCSKCRKVSGTDGNAVFYTAAANLEWIAGQHEISSFEVPGAAGWLSTFCSTCGSPTPHTNKDGKIYFVPAGLLDDDPGFRGYAAHIHVGSKAPWVRTMRLNISKGSNPGLRVHEQRWSQGASLLQTVGQ